VSKFKTSLMGIVFAGAAAAAYLSTSAGAPAAQPGHGAATNPVVLELYQSQGCSSCPPALAVLNDVANRPDVLALNFAVTYWDQLGWKDHFAQPAFTARQWDYARSSGRGNVQTPQLIVDGRSAILGSRKGEVEAAIASHRASPGAPEIANTTTAVTIGIGKTSAVAKVWLVSYDPRNIAVPIRAGENGGRTLGHRNIVKQLTALGAWKGNSVTYALPRGQSELARAILVQSGVGGPIIAARKI
jgi:hypothetical protein